MPWDASLAAYMPPISEDAPPPVFRSHLFVANGRNTRIDGQLIRIDGRIAVAYAGSVAGSQSADDGNKVGRTIRAASLLTCNDGYSSLVAPLFPRDVPWTELPLVGKPALKPTRSFFTDLRVEDLSEAASLQAAVAFSSEDGGLPDLAGHARLEAILGRRLPLILLRPDGSTTEVPAALVDEAEARARAWDRFRWNWNWNVRALMPSLIHEAFRTRRPPGSRGQGSAVEVDALAAVAHHPWLIQVLYRVAGDHPKPVPFPERRFPDPSILTGAGISRVSGGEFGIDWTGHRIVPDLPADHPASRAFVRILDHAILRAQRSGLLVATPERHARLSPPAAALLRLLPATCRDLGAPTRWMTEEGHVGTPDDIPAMDRWLTSMLRAIKKAANAVGATAGSSGRCPRGVVDKTPLVSTTPPRPA
jgi:hypothetical protein